MHSSSQANSIKCRQICSLESWFEDQRDFRKSKLCGSLDWQFRHCLSLNICLRAPDRIRTFRNKHFIVQTHHLQNRKKMFGYHWTKIAGRVFVSHRILTRSLFIS